MDKEPWSPHSIGMSDEEDDFGGHEYASVNRSTDDDLMVSRSGMGPTLRAEVIGELAKCFETERSATLLAKTSGLETRSIPSFDDPLTFWSEVCEKAEEGMLSEGMREICRAALETFGHNQVFKDGVDALRSSRRRSRITILPRQGWVPRMTEWRPWVVSHGVLAAFLAVVAFMVWPSECPEDLEVATEHDEPPSSPEVETLEDSMPEKNMLLLVGSGSVYRYLSSLTLPDGSSLLSPPGADSSNVTRHGELLIITLDVGSSVGLEMLDGAAKSAQKLGLNNLPMLAMSAREPSPEDLPEYLTPGTRFFAVRTDTDDDLLEVGVSRTLHRRSSTRAIGPSCWDSNRTTIDPEHLVTCIDSCIRLGRRYGRRAAGKGCWIFRTGDGSATWGLYTQLIRSAWPDLDRTLTADQWIEYVTKSARISDDDISRGLPDSASYSGPWIALGSRGLHRMARAEGVEKGREIDWLTVEGEGGRIAKAHYLVGRFQPCTAKVCPIGRLECKFLGLVETALSHKAGGKAVHAFPGVASQCREHTKPGRENIQFYPDVD